MRYIRVSTFDQNSKRYPAPNHILFLQDLQSGSGRAATAAALPTVAANALHSSSATPDPGPNANGAVASLSGQVLKITGEPLVGVTLRIDMGIDTAGKAASKAV